MINNRINTAGTAHHSLRLFKLFIAHFLFRQCKTLFLNLLASQIIQMFRILLNHIADNIFIFIIYLNFIWQTSLEILAPKIQFWFQYCSIFKIRIKEALFGVFIGNAIAGAIMLTVSMHGSEGISIELLIISILTIVATLYIIKQKKLNKEM